MKKIKDYIIEKLHINKNVKVISDPESLKLIVEKIYKVLISKYPTMKLNSMDDIEMLCTKFNEINKFGFTAISTRKYLTELRNDPFKIGLLYGSDNLPDAIKKVGNILIVDLENKSVKYFLWIANNLYYVKNNISEFEPNGYIFYTKPNISNYEIYTKQEILDMK